MWKTHLFSKKGVFHKFLLKSLVFGKLTVGALRARGHFVTSVKIYASMTVGTTISAFTGFLTGSYDTFFHISPPYLYTIIVFHYLYFYPNYQHCFLRILFLFLVGSKKCVIFLSLPLCRFDNKSYASYIDIRSLVR